MLARARSRKPVVNNGWAEGRDSRPRRPHFRNPLGHLPWSGPEALSSGDAPDSADAPNSRAVGCGIRPELLGSSDPVSSAGLGSRIRSKCPTNRYPRRCTVSMNRGCRASSPSTLRSSQIPRGREVVHKCWVPQISSISRSCGTTAGASSSNNASRRKTCGRRETSPPGPINRPLWSSSSKVSKRYLTPKSYREAGYLSRLKKYLAEPTRKTGRLSC